MNQITIIGNNASNQAISDGGRLKIRLYSDLLKKEGFRVKIIDLNNWKLRIFRLVKNIRKSIKNSEKIIIMAGPNGCRFIIPLVNFLNRKGRSQIVFCPLGVGTIDHLLKKMNPLEVNNFIMCNNFYGIQDKNIGKILKKCQFIIVQNNLLKRCYETFYNLNNVVVLKNFRYLENPEQPCNVGNTLKMVFYSRVCENKGIFDLIRAVGDILKDNLADISLDIYGEIQCENKIDILNNKSSKIKYCGIIKQEDSVEMLKKYDLFVLPTKYHGEGTPGSLIESLIAGTPALISSYSQSGELIKENVNGFIFEINNINSLKTKIIEISKNIKTVRSMRRSVIESSKEYLYENNRDDFLKYLG